MRVEVISVGSTLLTTELPDVNTKHVSSSVRDVGMTVTALVTVGDDVQTLADTIWTGLRRADIVVVLGVLNPDDSILLQATASATGRAILQGSPHLEGASVLGLPRDGENNFGLLIREPAGTILLLPANRRELAFLMENEVLPRLRREPMAPTTSLWAMLRTAGMMRSSLEDRLSDMELAPYQRVSLSSYAGLTDIRAYVEAETESEAEAQLALLLDAIRTRLGDFVYGLGADRLEMVLLRQLLQNGTKLVLAECNKGQAITNSWGASVNGNAAVELLPSDFTGGLRQRLEAARDNPLVNLTELCRSLAVNLRVKRDADLGLLIFNNYRPGGVQVLSVLSTPRGTTIRERSFGGHPRNVDEWSATLALVHLRNYLLAYPPVPAAN